MSGVTTGERTEGAKGSGAHGQRFIRYEGKYILNNCFLPGVAFVDV